MMAATTAAAGLGACSRPEAILPYVDQPEMLVPGIPVTYATTLSSQGFGIGADDVFVFYDAFKQSALVPHVQDNILDRVTYTAERASKAISVTSFTTMMAFLATAMSKVMPISAFGILSATMVFFLFVVNVAFFPPALMLYDRYVGKMCSCARLVGDKAANAEVRGSKPASADESPTSTDTLRAPALNDTARRVHAWESSEKPRASAPTRTKPANGGRVRRVTVNPFALRGSYAADGGDGGDDSSIDDAESGTKNFAMDKKRLRPVEWFYREPFFRFVTSPARYAILVAFVALLAAWLSENLGTGNAPVEVIDDVEFVINIGCGTADLLIGSQTQILYICAKFLYLQYHFP